MSWTDRINDIVFTIVTGDGKVYTPLWKNGETSKEFNAVIYDFINVDGSLVDRRKVRARKFPMVFWFTGEDNIEQADRFDLSANDNRAWLVKHPFYGDISGQPISISRNDTAYNVTEVQVEFWESIGGVLPKKTISIIDEVTYNFNNFKTISPIDYSSKVTLRPADVSQVTDVAGIINNLITKVLDDAHYADYQLAKNAMFAAIDTLILAPVEAISAIHAVLSLPAQFALSVSIRINLFKAILASIKNLVPFGRNNKAFYESCGGACIGAICLAAMYPITGDYVVRGDVATVVASLNDVYAGYLAVLDAAYVESTDPQNSFAASVETQTQLQGLVIDTIINLNTLAFNAKQERLVTLDRDSNLVLLAHRYMGLDADDTNLETFRQINGIKNRELLVVRKGRQLKYYVYTMANRP